MAKNNIKQLADLGQSVWLDDISRQLIQSGELQRQIDEIGIRGVTSNPTIFQKAIAGSDVYDTDITNLLKRGKQPAEVFQEVAVKDIQDACDIFRPLYDETNGGDGFVSIEVLPSLARDLKGTMDNARTLWNAVDRPNLMIKVPGTAEGAIATENLLTEDININITLLFSLKNYEAVARAYINALKARQAKGEPIDRLASVASFFVSRVDTLADKKIDEKLASGEGDAGLLKSLKGKVAIANARLAYQKFEELFKGDDFRPLAEAGAHVQRPLWASTGTKNPEYSDVLYVDTLIGPDTINTAPPKTIEAFLEHGTVERTVDADYAGAHKVLEDLKKAGIDLDQITHQLEDDGIESFITSYDDLLEGVEGKRSLITA